MKLIRSFFKYTRIFWIVSRLVLGIIFCYCAVFLLEGADMTDYFSAAFFTLLGLTLLWGFIVGLFRGGAPKWLKIPTGSILILLAFGMFYSTIEVFGVEEAALLLLLPLWFLMAGLFELMSAGDKKFKLSPQGLPEIPLNS